MWKSTRKVPFPKKFPSSTRKCPIIKLKSTTPVPEASSNTIVKTVVAVVGTATLGTGCVIGYAKYDPDFRKMVEENVPYSKNILSVFPEWTDISPEKNIIKPRDTSLPAPEQKAIEEERHLMSSWKEKKKLESQTKQETTKTPALPEAPIPVPPPPVPTSDIHDKTTSKPAPPTKEEASKKSVAAKKTYEELKQRLIEEETRNLEINDRLETNLKESLSKLETIVANALTTQSVAVDAIKQHTMKLYRALDASEAENVHDMWKDANFAMNERVRCEELASQKIAEIKEATKNLKSTVKEAMESKITAENPVLSLAEESINKALGVLKKMENEVSSALAESNIVDHYRTAIEKGKEQFKNELDAIVPEAQLKRKGGKLSEEDLNLLIVHAHKRVEQLQKQLAKHELTEEQHIKDALVQQKDIERKAAEDKMQEELAHQKLKLANEFKKKASEMKEEFEVEMHHQLRRQAAVHSEHLQDVLEAQAKKFEKKKEIALEKKMVEERSKFQNIMGTSLTKLFAIEQGLKAREELDNSAKRAQELWLACQSMKESIRTGKPELRPICSEVEAIRRCVDSSDTYLIAILDSIPQEALTRGIYTEEALKERFTQVDKVCRRVALIDNDHRSLFHYFLSMIQSFLIVDGSAIPKAEIANEIGVNPSEWNTFDILKRIRYSIIREDLQQALRYANQLKGEPKNVANSWIQETLLLLETKQAIEAIIAHAAAISIKAYH